MNKLYCAFLLIALVLCAAPAFAEVEDNTKIKAPTTNHPSITQQPDIRPLMCPQLYDIKEYERIKKDSFAFLIPGHDGWVFRTENDLDQDFRITEETKKGLQRFIKALKSRGADLVIISVPSRGLAHGDQFDRSIPITRGFNVAIANKHYQERVKALNDSGIPTVGLTNLKPKKGSFFYKLDHHWTQYGAEMMALATSEFIQKNISVYKDIPEVKFKVDQGVPVEHLGSFSDIVAKICGKPLPTEPAFDPQTSPRSKELSEANLFGDITRPEIVLLGTSFSTQETSYSNFEGYLKQYLSRDIINRSISGGGFDTSLLYFLTTKEFQEKPQKLMLWEFPSYYSLAEDKRGKELLRQALPNIFGDCGNKALKTSTTKITLPSTKLLDGFTVPNDQYYLSIVLSDPTQKNFRVISHREDGTTDNFRFRRGKRYPLDPNYLLSFDATTSPYSFVNMEPHKSMVGTMVTTKLCKMPDF